MPVRSHHTLRITLSSAFLALLTTSLHAQSHPGTVVSEAAISDSAGGLTISPMDNDSFGNAVAAVGDIDGDGVTDVMVGAPDDDTIGLNTGAVHLLRLNADGSVKGQDLISDGTFGIPSGLIDPGDRFGYSVANIGDLNGDGFIDVAVGAPNDDDGATNAGAIWVLFLGSGGMVTNTAKINDTSLLGALAFTDHFGEACAAIGDLDGDGVTEIAAGIPDADPAGFSSSALAILFMNADGTVKTHTYLSAAGGLPFTPGAVAFSQAVSPCGDLDMDGVPDLAVGAPLDDTGGNNKGAVYLLNMNTNGTIKSYQKVADGTPALSVNLPSGARFGASITMIGDVDEDGVEDLAIGASWMASVTGAVITLFLGPGGGPDYAQEVSMNVGDLQATWKLSDFFGQAITNLGDTDGNGIDDLFVGVPGHDGAGKDRGACHIVRLAGQWVDTGDALAGTLGDPILSGSGSLQPASPVSVNLSQAAPNAPAALMVGLTKIDAPVLGGTFVPSPDIVITGLFTGPAGTLPIAALWPSGVPSNLTFFFQYWIVDAAGPFGYSASNGLSGTTP